MKDLALKIHSEIETLKQDQDLQLKKALKMPDQELVNQVWT